MAGKRRPMAVNLSVVEGGGGKHWTKAEKEERLASEVKPKADKKVMAPKWLTDEALRKEFYSISKILTDMGVGFCQTDADFLGWYLTARQEYNAATRHVRLALNSGNSDDAKAWTATRNKFFSEARSCAQALGLTISDRCKLVVPAPKEPEVDPMEELRRKYMEA